MPATIDQPLTLETINPKDILMDPNHKTTLWRVIELDTESGRVRVVRSNKLGQLHGLVKDPSGSWLLASDVANYIVVGQYTGTDPLPQGPKSAAKKTTVPSVSGSFTAGSNGNAPNVRRVRGKGLKTTPPAAAASRPATKSALVSRSTDRPPAPRPRPSRSPASYSPTTTTNAPPSTLTPVAPVSLPIGGDNTLLLGFVQNQLVQLAEILKNLSKS